MHLLYVCTGNICRSPLAEGLTLAFARSEKAAFGAALTASSAGTAALVGRPIQSSAGLVLTGLGGNPEGFRARQLVVEHIVVADLVLTMTRRHRAAVLELAPRMMSRTFTLREAASLLAAVDAAGLADEPDVNARGKHLVAALGQLRAARVVNRNGLRDDIADPIGKSVETFQRVGDAISESLLPLLNALAGTGVWAEAQN